MAKQEYIEKNRQWLEQKAAEPGVTALGGGVLARVIASGSPDGPQPNLGSVVVVHYTGRTINGRKFDNSLGGTPPALRVRELIEGWVIALTRMHVGDKWEVYIPAEKGYGKRGVPGIPGGSTLIFEIELIGVA